MKFKFFMIPVQDADATQEELNVFCAGHQVANVEKEFVSSGEGSFWSICVTYLDKTKISPPVKSRID